VSSDGLGLISFARVVLYLRMSPRVLWWGLSVLAVILGPLITDGGSKAGDFHQSGSLACSDCHVMHYSEAHSLTGFAPPDVPLAGGGPFPRLLRQPASQLCLACHDGRTDAPDVLGANAGAYVRAAGALNRAGDAGEYAASYGHSLGSTDAPPGGAWSGNRAGGLECKHCHVIHGNQYYRNLTPDPGTATGKFVTSRIGLAYSGTAAIQQIVNTPFQPLRLEQHPLSPDAGGRLGLGAFGMVQRVPRELSWDRGFGGYRRLPERRHECWQPMVAPSDAGRDDGAWRSQ
jgi:hypothetical protein